MLLGVVATAFNASVVMNSLAMMSTSIFYGCEESNGESFEDWHACMTCLHDAFVDLIDSAATCSELEESGYCDAVQSCADSDCNNECSNESHILETCKMDSAECEDAYDSKCLTGM